ncbi:hypothetical protein GLE_1138 [Lysobacter enzymogenes]|uniref:Uncharacterized protein n=1 Tax=Lysobacter enzymogenes TaxID=69 RepID=A0A0S2DDE7_LYSEN|nr:hypothetical protein GLE_1138 [Lysobacter enzymogenes]
MQERREPLPRQYGYDASCGVVTLSRLAPLLQVDREEKRGREGPVSVARRA